MSERSQKNRSRDERRFGLLFGGIFAILSLWGQAEPNFYWAGGAAACLVAAVICPRALGPIYRSWMAFGYVLGWINTKVILGIIFYLVVVPTGMLMRRLGHDPLNLRQRPEGGNWIERGDIFKPDSMRNQF